VQEQDSKSLDIPDEALNSLDPTESLADDDDANDFSKDSLADAFEGFTADSPGEGI
jgi:hypothetical protein